MDNKLVWDANIEENLSVISFSTLYAPLPQDLKATDMLIVSAKGVCHSVLSVDYTKEEISIQKDLTLKAERIKSLSYWYLDDFKNGYQKDIDNMGYISKFSYDPTNCYLHFVFGVNIPGADEVADIREVSRKIYLSLMTKKDLRVFDKYHQIAGKVENEVLTEKYGQGQYFLKKS